MHGRERFLTEQHDGWSIIYHDTDIHDTTGISGQIKSQVKSAQWIHIHTWVTKGMYGLPQAGRISHDDILKHPEPYRYLHSRKNPVLWTHNS